MTNEEIRQAVANIKTVCDERMAGYKMTSARGALRKLGYSVDEQDEVIRAIAAAGFDYCLDPTITARGSEGYSSPSSSACAWGPDQLRSRLDAIEWKLAR